MTAPKEQIQALIAEIDRVLQQTTPRLPWVMSGDATQQRKLLERLRNHLLVLYRQFVPPVSDRPLPPSDNGLYDIYYQPSWATPLSQMASGQPSERTTQQMLHMMTQEILHLRSTLVEPLQSELSSLRQQRDALQAEVRQLEMQRQTYLLHSQQLLNESMQGWMDRLQTNFPQALGPRSPSSPNLLAEPDSPHPWVSGDRSASPMPNLTDAAIAAEAIPEPTEPLSSKVSGPVAAVTQPEAPEQAGMLMAEAATTPPKQTPRAQPAPPRPAAVPPRSSASKSWVVDLDPALRDVGNRVESSEDWQFPYPGIEVASPMAEPPAPTTMRSMEDAIDDWLRSANSREEDAPSALEFADLELAELRPGQLEAQEIDSLLVAKDAAVAGGPLLDSELLEAELLDFELEAEPGWSSDTGNFSADGSAATLDKTLDGTLSLSFEEELTAPLGVPTDAPSSPAVWPAQPETPAAANQTRNLDEFYESLFGSAGTAPFTEELFSAQPKPFTLEDDERSQTSSPSELNVGSSAPELLAPPNTYSILGESSSDQISSLEDLFETLPADISEGSPEVSISSGSPASSALHPDDRFMLASPDETLLPSAADRPGSEPSLELDAVTFNSLSEDLSNLERTPPPSRPAPQRSNKLGGDARSGDPLGVGDLSLDDLSLDELSLDPLRMEPTPLSRSFTELEEQPPAISAIPVAPPQQNSWPDFSLDEFAGTVAEESTQSARSIGMPATGVPAESNANPVDTLDLNTANRPDSERRGVLDALREAERLVPDFGSLTAVNRLSTASKGQQSERQSPPPERQTASLTIADMAELFPDAPLINENLPINSPPPANANTPEPLSDGAAATFTVERLDDLFVEIPMWEASSTPGSEPASETATVDFTLDPIDNVFVEVLPDPIDWLSREDSQRSSSPLDSAE